MIILTILFIALSVNYAVCGTYNTKIHLLEQNLRLTRDTYKFNHPPTVEDSEPIPVAVVYDGEKNREGKTIKVSENTKVPEKQSVEIVKEVVSATNGTNQNIKPADDNKKDNLKDTPTTNNILHIPVAVVYETESKTERSQRNYKTNIKEANAVSKRDERISQKSSSGENKSNLKIESIKNNVSELPVIKKISRNSEKQTESKKYTESQNSSVSQKESNNEISKNQTEIKIIKRTRQRDPVIPIIEMENHVYSHTGEFQYSYEGGDGTKAFEKGELKSFDNESAGEAVIGGFSYKDKDGKDYSLTYTADENGYRPVGAHLPTPPPIPPAIARALKYLATKTTPKEDTVTEKTKK